MATVDSGRINSNKLEIARLVSNLKEKYPELPDDAVQDLVVRFEGNESGIDNHILQFRSLTAVTTSSTNNYPTMSLNTTIQTNDRSTEAHTPEATYSRDRVYSERAPSTFNNQDQTDSRLAASYPWYPQQQRIPSPRPPNFATNMSNDSLFSNHNKLESRTSNQDPFQIRQEQQLSAFQTSFNSSGSSLSEYFTAAVTQSPDLRLSPNPYSHGKQIDSSIDGNQSGCHELQGQGDRRMVLPSLHPDQSFDLDSSIHRPDLQRRQSEVVERLRQQKIRFHNISKVYNSLSEDLDQVRTELSTAEKRILGYESAKNPTQNDIKNMSEKTSMLRREVQLMMDELDKFGDTAPLGADDEPNQIQCAMAPSNIAHENSSPSKQPPPRPTPPLIGQYPNVAVPPPSYEQRTMYPLVSPSPPISFSSDLPPRYNELPPGPCDHVSIGAVAAGGGMPSGTQRPNSQSISVEESEVDGKWNCPRCTFSNHIALPECEVCEWKRT